MLGRAFLGRDEMGADIGIVRPERERRAHRRAGVDAAADDDLSVPEGTNRGHESARRQQARMSARARRHEHQPVDAERSEEHTSELQSLIRISYAVFCLKTKTTQQTT